MPLDWDVKLDSTSIRDEIVSFSIRESKGSYVRELTLFSANSDFYDLFQYTVLPSTRVEVLTKVDTTWVSQGFFFIENPALRISPEQTISPSVWGRSVTAKAGAPFASKVTTSYSEDTTFGFVIADMADRCGLTITSEITDFFILANTYVVDDKYPIEVIAELAEIGGGYLSSTLDGALLVKQDTYHPDSADHVLTDATIADLIEESILPEFGNRVRISALGGVGLGYTVSLYVVENGDCLPADSVSQGTILAFVTDSESAAVPDNTLVNWSADEGVTLASDVSNTGNYLLSNQEHRASNYYSVDVDFPIVDVIGIWAYADGNNSINYWDADHCSFEDRTIVVATPFAFCDQALRVTYITGGCAVNIVTAGHVVKDVEITAYVDGAEDALDVKLGNTCACGSSLNARVVPVDAICLGNMAHILIWATINNAPATGYPVIVHHESGCGELSSENKILKAASIVNEEAHAQNVISGVSQTNCAIYPDDGVTPAVYLASDTSKSNDLYSSHDGTLIDLISEVETGTSLVIDYTGTGATLVSWRTLNATKDCDADIVVTMADGTEAGLRQELKLYARDCAVPDDIPEHNEEVSDTDPTSFNGGDDGSGGYPDPESELEGDYFTGGGLLDPCDLTIVNRVLNIDNSVDEADRDGWRFGTHGGATDCPENDDEECTCSELCQSEVDYNGGTYDQEQTIHEIVSEMYDKETETAAYNEAFEVELQSQLATCVENCESNRNEICGTCEVSGPDILDQGESAEYVCEDGSFGTFTMPEDACGLVEFTLGCCTFEVRCSYGQWIYLDGSYISYWQQTGDECHIYSLTQDYCNYDVVEDNVRYIGTNGVFYGFDDGVNSCSGCASATPVRAGTCLPTTGPSCPTPIESSGCISGTCIILRRSESTYIWSCP